MANVTEFTSQSRNSGFAGLVASLKARRARRKVYNETFRELSALSNRELADLGLGRSEIRRVALQAANEI